MRQALGSDLALPTAGSIGHRPLQPQSPPRQMHLLFYGSSRESAWRALPCNIVPWQDGRRLMCQQLSLGSQKHLWSSGYDVSLTR